MGSMEEENEVNGCSDLEWLDNAYITTILTTYVGKPISVKNFNKKPATSKGENFASTMYLVEAEYIFNDSSHEGLNKISMIVKSRLKGELMEEIEQEFNVFEREAQVYRCLMTSCEKLLQSIGDSTIFGPRAIYVDDRVIVQENLKEKGYTILDVKKGFDYEECKTILEKLAKFHATTMILYEKNSDIFKYHQKGNVSEKHTPLHDLYKNSLEVCIEYIKTIPELEKYASKLNEYSKDVIQKLIKVFSRNSTGINVLNHGDAWVNNFMFKKDSKGKIQDLLLVDYQEGYFGSPGIDINFFIYSSWQKDLYLNRMDDLISNYHDVFATTLTKLNYGKIIPTLQDIWKEIKFKGHHGLITATCLLPILISEHPDLSDPATFLEDTEEAKRNRLTVFRNKRYAELLKIYLKDFVNQGIL